MDSQSFDVHTLAVVFTYGCILVLMIANDKDVMGRHVNGKVMKVVGWLIFTILILLNVFMLTIILTG
ncbi:hypothetical protein DRO26_01690 [Candidatus Bathyarchaeota archaeon]|nr:MAG: hypothetical protein DRO26_01690 [Candidatus Bathyarchaeota archaeon]